MESWELESLLGEGENPSIFGQLSHTAKCLLHVLMWEPLMQTGVAPGTISSEGETAQVVHLSLKIADLTGRLAGCW